MNTLSHLSSLASRAATVAHSATLLSSRARPSYRLAVGPSHAPRVQVAPGTQSHSPLPTTPAIQKPRCENNRHTAQPQTHAAPHAPRFYPRHAEHSPSPQPLRYPSHSAGTTDIPRSRRHTPRTTHPGFIPGTQDTERARNPRDTPAPPREQPPYHAATSPCHAPRTLVLPKAHSYATQTSNPRSTEAALWHFSSFISVFIGGPAFAAPTQSPSSSSSPRMQKQTPGSKPLPSTA